jgi:8-oxo-dGTP pyrophosphatase MutT (NUDIX family)
MAWLRGARLAALCGISNKIPPAAPLRNPRRHKPPPVLPLLLWLASSHARSQRAPTFAHALPPRAPQRMKPDPRIEQLRANLAEHHALRLCGAGQPRSARASVALVVRPEGTGLALLLIRRAVRQGDPWSGHMAFPGGRREPDDSSAQETAIRETHEEVGVDLRATGAYLGRLGDVRPASAVRPIVISSFVFAVPPGTATTTNVEVDWTVWIPLQELAAPGAATEYLHRLEGGRELRFPAIGHREHVIWGLTYRIMRQFLHLATPMTDHRSQR